MVKSSSEYASCLCIQMFSSSGINLILGRMKRMIVLQTGSRMSMPSTLRTRPAPRDIHTEYCSVLRPARRGSLSCFHHPYAKMPQWNVQNKTWNTSLEGVNCFLRSERSGILATLTPPSVLLRHASRKCRPATRRCRPGIRRFRPLGIQALQDRVLPNYYNKSRIAIRITQRLRRDSSKKDCR